MQRFHCIAMSTDTEERGKFTTQVKRSRVETKQITTLIVR